MPEEIVTPVLSSAAIERLREEHERLTTEGRRDISERLLRARELGDLSENAEYDQTKNDQAQMEARIRYLEWTIKNAVIQEGPVTTDEAGPGMIVTLKPLDDDDDEDEQYLFARSKEERAQGVRTITTQSPLGQALMGAKPGDEIAYDAPVGKVRYQVVEFHPWDGR